MIDFVCIRNYMHVFKVGNYDFFTLGNLHFACKYLNPRVLYRLKK